MTLPCGDIVNVDRGSGQGEPEGPLKSAVVIGDAAGKTKQEAREIGLAPLVDKWFIDDGQLFLKPGAVDGTLRLLDKHLMQAGASRGKKSEGTDVKSRARLLCPANRAAEFGG